MQITNIKLSCINEAKATRLVFDAARANEKREPRTVEGYEVRFQLRADGAHAFSLRDGLGVVVALGVVDQFDV